MNSTHGALVRGLAQFENRAGGPTPVPPATLAQRLDAALSSIAASLHRLNEALDRVEGPATAAQGVAGGTPPTSLQASVMRAEEMTEYANMLANKAERIA